MGIHNAGERGESGAAVHPICEYEGRRGQPHRRTENTAAGKGASRGGTRTGVTRRAGGKRTNKRKIWTFFLEGSVKLEDGTIISSRADLAGVFPPHQIEAIEKEITAGRGYQASTTTTHTQSTMSPSLWNLSAVRRSDNYRKARTFGNFQPMPIIVSISGMKTTWTRSRVP